MFFQFNSLVQKNEMEKLSENVSTNITKWFVYMQYILDKSALAPLKVEGF